jgi:hypothetical protein
MDTRRSNMGGFIGGAVLIGLGLVALLAQFVGSNIIWNYVWPFIIVGFGGLFFVAMLVGGKQAGGFAIPGSIISGIGLILLYQNLTNHWESWSYAWTVILMLVGFGIFISGLWSGNDSQRQSGLRVLKVGFILFVIFGALFEIVFSNTFAPGFRQIVFPVLLILLGLYLIVSRAGLFGSRTSQPAVQPVEPIQPCELAQPVEPTQPDK